MEKYKRLTKRDAKGQVILKDSSARGVVRAIEYLARLEDKIENGALNFWYEKAGKVGYKLCRFSNKKTKEFTDG